MEEGGVSKPVAVIACTAMAFFYVAILYAPTLILRLPPPASFKSFMIRRFICAGVSSLVSVIVCALILPIRSWEVSHLFGVYGIRLDHIWQAVVFPLSLTSLMYAGSLVLKSLLLLNSLKEHWNCGGDHSFDCIKSVLQKFTGWMFSIASDVSAWRNYFVVFLFNRKFTWTFTGFGCLIILVTVITFERALAMLYLWGCVQERYSLVALTALEAPLTEELVFRACMIPLLLCGGFKTYSVIFFCPVFFSLAHLNHLLELYTQQNFSLLKASMVVGLQVGYTVVFGSYASFLFIRTGHLTAPLVAHIFCNIMGLPALYSRTKGMVCVTFIAGMVSFLWLLFPLTRPDLYNGRTDKCWCWHRYCAWN